jgi:hypothetical protein
MWKAANELLISVPFLSRCFGARERLYKILVLLCAMAAACGGCKKPSSSEQVGQPPASASPSTVRIHWLGKKRISAETNAVGFMKIWNLPESARLEAQTLDKLALALGNQLPITNSSSPITNYNAYLGGLSAMVRPLLGDLLEEEFFFEMRNPTNQPWVLALAARLNETSAGLWQTNLAAAVQIFPGVRATQNVNGWQAHIEDLRPLLKGLGSPPANPQPSRLELTRAGEWTIFSLAAEGQKSTTISNPLLAEIRSRIESSSVRAPFTASGTNLWLEAEMELAAVAPGFLGSVSLPQNLPRLAINLIGDGENVRTRGHLDFPKPIPYQAEPWNIPTNLMSQPLTSFTAIRGMAPWLSSLSAWNDLKIGPPPNQLYVWALQAPMQTYFAAPQPIASNQVSSLTTLVLEKGAAFFATNGISKFEKAPSFNGLKWGGVPAIAPFVQSFEAQSGSFIFGGLFPIETTNAPPSIALLAQFLGQTNLICYDWELGGLRSEGWYYLGQFFRFASFRQQMRAESAGLAWLKSVSEKLGNCGTTVTITAPNQLSLVRISRVGLTAFELHLLADWLEGPEFPHGLHSFQPATPASSSAQNEVPPAKL